MSDNNEFSDDVVDDEAPEDEENGLEEAAVAIRTVLMAKDEMLALLGLKTSTQGGLIVRIDPRQPLPSAQRYEDEAAATMWFNRSLASSKKNGWLVIHDGAPCFG